MNNQINKITKLAYGGKNQKILRMAKNMNSYKSNEWMTFLQAKKLDLKVKKGSKGIRLMKVIVNEDDEHEGVNYFTVFNEEQTEPYKEVE